MLASSVVINEIMANPNDDTEWVEIYNTTNQTIDLSNWLIKDGNSLTNDDIILTGQINPFSFIVFDHNKRWLNDSGDETVTLLNNSNQPIDSYQYSGTTKGKTYGRQPDGENWIANLNPSKGSSNGSQAAPTIAPTPSPTLSPTPTPTPTPTSTPQPISSFTISSSQTQINADQILNVTINLTLTNKPNTKFFLKGAFRKPGSTNYFGYTKVNNNWIKNSSNYLEQYAITTDQTGNWTGNLEIKPDTEDKGYTGSDDYSLKVGKYDSTDSSPSVSWTNNELTIKISSVSNQDANTDTNSNSSTATPLPTPIATVLATNKTVSATKHPKITSQNATVAGIQKTASRPASPSANINVKNDRQFHPLILTGITLVLIGVGTIGYIYLKKNVKIPF